MHLSNLAILLGGSFVAAQTTYSNLNVQFLNTSTPVTPLPAGFPWGSRTAENTNAYHPNTGVIRRYDFTIARKNLAPDGVSREFLTINGQFPGPLIEANWGDTIQVTVHNKIDAPKEGTALHWHGILQKESQWMDGVPAVTQCPIPPGGTFTYSFIADLYGSSWYHSHYSAQYAGGLVGPMVIHGPDANRYDVDIGPILLTDHYHEDYFTLVEKTISTNINDVVQLSDNNLINGKNNCSAVNTACASTGGAGVSTFKFTPGRVHKLRLINAGAEAIEMFSIDGHNMTVVANDFVPVRPYNTQVVTLGIGQRTDVLVRAPAGASGSYTMRSSIAACSLSVNPHAIATVYYGNTAPTTLATTTAWPAFLTSVASKCANDDLSLTQPLFPIAPNPAPPTTKNIAIGFGQNATNFWQWTMNGVSFRANYNNPILLLSNLGNNSYPQHPEWNVYNFGSNSSIRLVIENPGFAAHPIHLHGHNFWVLDVGTGSWDGSKVIRPNNPQRRDVQIVPAAGYLVMQITSDNPGAWPLHCHIAWHVSAGLYVTVVERPADIRRLRIPSVMAQTCRDWAAFTGANVVNQIDSGL